MGKFFPVGETKTTDMEVYVAICLMISFVGTGGFLKEFARCGLVFISQAFGILITCTRILNLA